MALHSRLNTAGTRLDFYDDVTGNVIQSIDTATGGSLSSATDGITAFATGGQASATPLTTTINRVTVVATGGDSVKLPSAVPGKRVTVTNATAATSMNVFPSSGQAINLLANDAAFAVAGNKTAEFVCAVAGKWSAFLSA